MKDTLVISKTDKYRKFPRRKELRLKNYNYRNGGYYFVTICTYNQKPNIEQYKHIVEQALLSLPNKFKGLTIDWHILMPTHIHTIFILDDVKITLGEIVRTFKALVTKNTEKSFWQKNYFEHIIRNEEALRKIREYVENNPLVEKLKFEEFYEKWRPYRKAECINGKI